MRISGWKIGASIGREAFTTSGVFLPEHGQSNRRENARAWRRLRHRVSAIEPLARSARGMWENLWAHLILSRRELAEYRTMSNPLAARAMDFRAGHREGCGARVGQAPLRPRSLPGRRRGSGRKRKAAGRRPLASKLGVVPPRVSISHKGTVAVAAAAAHDLGIDIEAVEPRGDAFETVAFDERERRILGGFSGPHRDEWTTRAWCAKEAAGKVTGFGLNGNPRSLIVERIDPGQGQIVVSRQKPALSETGERFVVQSIRDGDFVIALAVNGKNDDAEISLEQVQKRLLRC